MKNTHKPKMQFSFINHILGTGVCVFFSCVSCFVTPIHKTIFCLSVRPSVLVICGNLSVGPMSKSSYLLVSPLGHEMTGLSHIIQLLIYICVCGMRAYKNLHFQKKKKKIVLYPHYINHLSH